jgi:hypothetical protein
MPAEKSERWGYDFEHKLVDSALTFVPELDLVDQASLRLGYILQTFDEGAAAQPQIANALVLMTILAFRATRAAGLVIAAGYSSEALVQARRLTELVGHATEITQDRTGQRAEKWVRGQSSRAGKQLDIESWKELSPGAHSDVWHLLRMSRPDLIGVRFMPSRFDQDWLACVAVALWAKDLITIVHDEAEITHEGLATLDRRITETLDRRERGQLTLW